MAGNISIGLENMKCTTINLVLTGKCKTQNLLLIKTVTKPESKGPGMSA